MHTCYDRTHTLAMVGHAHLLWYDMHTCYDRTGILAMIGHTHLLW